MATTGVAVTTRVTTMAGIISVIEEVAIIGVGTTTETMATAGVKAAMELCDAPHG
jgi:translation elongation factor EF-Tu-like GTPase